MNNEITTASGRLLGEQQGQHRRWAGIPYAEPPVGPRRWMPPQPVASWQGVRDSTRFGHACWQITSRMAPESSIVPAMMAEDCLTLNIWAPVNPPAGPLPVLVWFHGGAFRLGASWLPLYDGDRLAEQGAVVVSVNYRLGPFAVFAHPALSDDPAQAMNFGLLDQIQALKWLQQNIGYFGGDPHNITLWGESAGGASVGYLLQSPLSQGLFQKAIMQSGALDLPEYSRAEARKLTTQALPAGINALSAEQLRQLTPQELLALPLDRPQTMPVIDGVSLTATTAANLAAGRVSRVPLLIGSNNYEAGFFPPGWSASLPTKMGANWLAASALSDGYGSHSESLKAAQLAGDKFATLPTRRFADAVAAQGGPVWRYYFSWVSPARRASLPGAIHTAEIPYVFGNLAALEQPSAEDEQLSARLMTRWLQFARTGSPNAVDLPAWPAWCPGEATLWSIADDGESAIAEPGAARLDFLQQHDDFSMN